MVIEGVRLINFRNYKNISVEFGRNINVLIGKNAQGKTNILEAIYMCSTGKSFRTSKDKELILFGKKEAYVGADIKIGNLEKLTEIKLDVEKPKRIKINKVELKNYRELNTGLKVVVFSPDDLKLVKDGPGYRRDYLDICISQIKPVYQYNLNRFLKVLIQRNNLLKSKTEKNELNALLDVFDTQIARLATLISMERRQHIKRVLKEAREIHNNITSEKELFDMKYITNMPDEDSLLNIEKKYKSILLSERKRDLEFGNTSIGPHRDDFLMTINGKDSRIYASQGQQRSLVLTLKLSEVNILEKETGFFPVLLMDDVYSELDEERRVFITKLFSKMQTFITITDAVEIESLASFKKQIFYIEEGCIRGN
ncbi:MAG: DNA replication/repair protein RecF [Gudongella sp.]|nr:DNA replication/repair protein RecF [Gudongella sp.]